jgi:hypothetical protein
LTKNSHVLPRTRSISAERQRHAAIVAGLGDTTPIGARRLEKSATTPEKTNFVSVCLSEPKNVERIHALLKHFMIHDNINDMRFVVVIFQNFVE